MTNPPTQPPYPGDPGAGQQWPYPGSPQYPGAVPQPGFPQNPGGQPYPGAQPYPGWQPYPGGQPGPGGELFGTPPQPPPRKRSHKLVWSLLGVMVVLVVAIVVGLAFLGRDSVTGNDDVAVGDCVSLKHSSGGNDMEAAKTDCSADKLTFYVAQKIAKGACRSDAYDRLYWTKHGSRTGEQLCLTPNLMQGKCYQIPVSSSSSPGRLENFKAVDCATAAAAGTLVGKVDQRTSGEPSCTEDQIDAYYLLPHPTGYCVSTTHGT